MSENMAPGATSAAVSAEQATQQPLPEDRVMDCQPAPSRTYSMKGLLAVALLAAVVVSMTTLGVQQLFAGRRTTEDDTVSRERPAAATGEPRRLAMPAWAASSALVGSDPRIPAIEAMSQGSAEPIEVRSSGVRAAAGLKKPLPEDAPVLLVGSRAGASGSAAAGPVVDLPAAADDEEDGRRREDALAATTRNLQAYQRQLQGTLDQLTRSTDLAAPAGLATGGAPTAATGSGLFGGALAGSSTPRAAARTLGDASLTLPKGTVFRCALKTRVVSATSGLIGCQVQRHVFSADGRVVLVERGSHVDGEYRMTSVRPGVIRIPVLWTRIRTPLGVVVELESPATGPLGESGIDGYVDNRWGERLGAAMLLSVIDDALKLAVQEQSAQAGTVVLPATTSGISRLAEKVLDSTVNLPPLIYRNQGGIVGVHVARDVDFSTVYALVPTSDGEVR